METDHSQSHNTGTANEGISLHGIQNAMGKLKKVDRTEIKSPAVSKTGNYILNNVCHKLYSYLQ